MDRNIVDEGRQVDRRCAIGHTNVERLNDTGVRLDNLGPVPAVVRRQTFQNEARPRVFLILLSGRRRTVCDNFAA